MALSVSNFGLALLTVFLVCQISEARDLPSTGLLDEMPKNCSEASFCLVKHEKYPQEHIDELLTKKYHLSLGNPREDIDHRDGPDAESQNDCEKDVTYGEIYEILDENENVRVVVQSSKLFKQQIRIERCLNPGLLNRETDHFTRTELEEFNVYCVEKTIDYNFLVLTRDGKGVESVKSKHGIPVCCSCRISL